MRKFVVFFPCVSSERRDTARRQHQQKHAPQKGRRDHRRRRRRRRLHSKRAADDDDGKEMNQSINREREMRERKALCKCRHSISVFSLRLSRILKASLSLSSPLFVFVSNRRRRRLCLGNDDNTALLFWSL